MRAPAPQLPLPRQDTPGAGVVTPPRRDDDRDGGSRDTIVSEGDTSSSSDFYGSGPDRRNVPWSPENVLVDTVARLQRDLADMRAESQFIRHPDQ